MHIEIIISSNDRFSQTKFHWKRKRITWEDFCLLLKIPTQSTFTLEEYQKLTNAYEQLRIKSGGRAYVGGELKNQTRKKEEVVSRYILTLDIDEPSGDILDQLKEKFKDLAWFYHTTFKSTPEKPKCRVIILLSEPVRDEKTYTALSFEIANQIGIEYFGKDTSSLTQWDRCMFYPCIPKYGKYEYYQNEGMPLDVHQAISPSPSLVPPSQPNSEIIPSPPSNIEDPYTKPGMIGLFNRSFQPITIFIDQYLSRVYTPTRNPLRYKLEGSTNPAGLWIHPEGKLVYSHHETDPAKSYFQNAYDLAKIHGPALKFFQDGKARTRHDWMNTLPAVKEQRLKEMRKGGEFQDWEKNLLLNTKGTPAVNQINLQLIFENDPVLKGKYFYNEFDYNIYVQEKDGKPQVYSDRTESWLINYFAKQYSLLRIKDLIKNELEDIAHKHSRHTVREHLDSLKYDGVTDPPALFCDLFHITEERDRDYAMKMFSIFLVAAVYRIYHPGYKYDSVLTLVGPQGTGKSSFFEALAVCPQWFSNTLEAIDNKDAKVQLRGKWIIEIAERFGIKQVSSDAIKAFLSASIDHYRAPYERIATDKPRQCVLAMTTNDKKFLKDKTGNRRFLCIEIKSPARDQNKALNDFILDPDKKMIRQCWAWAVQQYKEGAKTYLPYEYMEMQKEVENKFSVEDMWAGIIFTKLEIPLPEKEEWENKNIEERRYYLNNYYNKADNDPYFIKGEERREKVCSSEILVEFLGLDLKNIGRKETIRINDIMRDQIKWDYINILKRFSLYGLQRYFKRPITGEKEEPSILQLPKEESAESSNIEKGESYDMESSIKKCEQKLNMEMESIFSFYDEKIKENTKNYFDPFQEV